MMPYDMLGKAWNPGTNGPMGAGWGQQPQNMYAGFRGRENQFSQVGTGRWMPEDTDEGDGDMPPFIAQYLARMSGMGGSMPMQPDMGSRRMGPHQQTGMSMRPDMGQGQPSWLMQGQPMMGAWGRLGGLPPSPQMQPQRPMGRDPFSPQIGTGWLRPQVPQLSTGPMQGQPMMKWNPGYRGPMMKTRGFSVL